MVLSIFVLAMVLVCLSINQDNRFSTPQLSFLYNVLQVPFIKINLLSVQKFTVDTNIYFEYHPYCFSVNDWNIGKTLLHRPSRNKLYTFSTCNAERPLLLLENTHLSHAYISHKNVYIYIIYPIKIYLYFSPSSPKVNIQSIQSIHLVYKSQIDTRHFINTITPILKLKQLRLTKQPINFIINMNIAHIIQVHLKNIPSLPLQS